MDFPAPAIGFVTDGRVYEPTGPRSGEFVVVFGTLVKGPATPPAGALVVNFSAELSRPDGTQLRVGDAHVDYPIEDESPGEGPLVLLRGVHAGDVPAGTLIVSLGRRS